MDSQATYRVQFTGQFLPGVEAGNAVASFASLAKIAQEQAAKVLSGPRTLKKQLSLPMAESYCNKLQSIGLEVVLESEAPPAPAFALSLEPIVDRHAAQEAALSAAGQSQARMAEHAGPVTCPKCGHEQDHADRCESCGVYIHKVLARQKVEAEAPVREEPPVAPAEADQEEPVEGTVKTSQDPRWVAIPALVVVALVSAYVWKLIAVATEYEVGIVAWGIGGAIGFTAIALGSVGIRTGVLCAVLALGAIIGGKYLVIDAFFDQISGEVKAALVEATTDESWEGDMEAARYFAQEVDTDAEIRQFMLDHDYTEADTPEAISDEDMTLFRDEIAPYLRNLGNNPLSAESAATMEGSALFEQYTGFNAWTGLWQSLGLIDFLFFFLGVGTAFRMGVTGRIK